MLVLILATLDLLQLQLQMVIIHRLNGLLEALDGEWSVAGVASENCHYQQIFWRELSQVVCIVE